MSTRACCHAVQKYVELPAAKYETVATCGTVIQVVLGGKNVMFPVVLGAAGL